jgi:hypothetical protein
MPVAIEELRSLIIAAAPDPSQAAPVRTCGEDEALDSVIPFSSIIVLGVVVAIEDRFQVAVTRDMLAAACSGGVSLRKLAQMIERAGTPR